MEEFKPEVKYENRNMVVSTPKGNIVVSVDCDDSYPGVSITFESDENIKESALTCIENEIDLVRVEYVIAEKKLQALVWDEIGNEDYTKTIDFTDALVFNEDFTILEEGTKIEYNDKIAYITGDDRENCPDGYHDSLNYYIKFALENETYEELCKRIRTEDWYDDAILWHWAKVIE